jgi:hypothetical protein
MTIKTTWCKWAWKRKKSMKLKKCACRLLMKLRVLVKKLTKLLTMFRTTAVITRPTTT